MAKNETETVGQDFWTEITDNDVSSATFQVTGPNDVRIIGTVGAAVPTSTDDGIIYPSGEGETLRTLAELFPGIVATRLYAKSLTANSKVFISHD